MASRATKHVRKPQIREWEEGGRNERIMKPASLGANNRRRKMHVLVAKFCRNLGWGLKLLWLAQIRSNSDNLIKGQRNITTDFIRKITWLRVNG